MGQNISEELGSLQQEYKATEKAVRANMKQRDRAIRNLRTEIDNVRLHGFRTTRDSQGILPSTSLRQVCSRGFVDFHNLACFIRTLQTEHFEKGLFI